MPSRASVALRVAACAAALVLGGAATAVAAGPGALTTQAGRWAPIAAAVPIALVLGPAIGASRDRRVLLALATAVCWTGPVWLGWADGPPLVRGLGGAIAAFLLPTVALWPTPSSRRIPRLAARVVVLAATAGAAVEAVVEAAAYQPQDDPACWADCVAAPFLLVPDPALAAAVEAAWRIAELVLGPSVAVLAVLGHSSVLARTGTAIAALALALRAAVLLAGPENSLDAGDRTAFLGVVLGLGLLALDPVVVRAGLGARRRAIGRIVADLGDAPEPGTLARALGSAVGDPTLRIAYALDDGRLVDALGAPVAGDGEVSTVLSRDDRTIAVVTHRRSAAEAVGRLGSGVRLALDNERLRAALLAEAADIRSSRERIVAAGDDARRRIERDLHDGVQQRLIALSYHLRVVRGAAIGNGLAEARLTSALDACLAALAELRTVAHGIHPAVLVHAGLGPALADLADIAPVPVSTVVEPAERLPPPIEATAYAIVLLTVADAAERGATAVDVRVVRAQDQLMIRIRADGVEVPVVVADRAGAVGGAVGVLPDGLEVTLPCG